MCGRRAAVMLKNKLFSSGEGVRELTWDKCLCSLRVSSFHPHHKHAHR